VDMSTSIGTCSCTDAYQNVHRHKLAGAPSLVKTCFRSMTRAAGDIGTVGMWCQVLLHDGDYTLTLSTASQQSGWKRLATEVQMAA